MTHFFIAKCQPAQIQRTRARFCSIAFVATLAAAPPIFAANSNGGKSNAYEIETLSTAAHLVTGGNVLVRIDVPRNVALESTRVTLNGVDVTAKFVADASTQSMTGLVTGLALGENTLEASAPRGNGDGGPHKELKITNYPITGPIISGPHERRSSVSPRSSTCRRRAAISDRRSTPRRPSRPTSQ
ncbi:MAG: hypothetical protein AUG50_01005 [Betaproteobacteria bacterium 13_1_20CM_3_63_8]|nr:MAG: hypothetical protein AUG50_01005 [Betaproteobacteria bacterium 13_1_20CM_3_63_8]